MKFTEIIARADSVLNTLMPNGAVPLVTAIDPQLAYPKNLSKVLLKLRPPHDLLDEQNARTTLLMLLRREEANELSLELGPPPAEDVYDYLKKFPFKQSGPRRILFRFFGVDIPPEADRVPLVTTSSVHPQYALFTHQANALLKVENMLSREPHRALLHMPTGSGKTRTAMNVVANYLRGCENGVVVWLAHSPELCEQAADEFTRAWALLGSRPLPLIRLWGNHNADLKEVDDGIVIAGLKKALSLLKADDHQLRALSSRDPLVIMDEAHQAIAPTYQLIINQLMRPMSKSCLLGLSATPGRTWNDPEADKKLADFFSGKKVSLSVEGYDNPVEYLIKDEYLAKPTYHRIQANSSAGLTAEETRQVQDTFDLPDSVLDRLAADEQRNLLIVHHAEQLLKRHKRVILFAASVDQSDLLAAVLSARGVWASSITSKSNIGRAEAIASFKEASVIPKIICNFGVLTTGFDAPMTSAALIARPTLSLVLYSQMVGRAMRGPRAGGNKECEILTVIDTDLPGFKSVVSAFENWEDVWKTQP
jgi:superfamily II DNA or RNA helicase